MMISLLYCFLLKQLTDADDWDGDLVKYCLCVHRPEDNFSFSHTGVVAHFWSGLLSLVLSNWTSLLSVGPFGGRDGISRPCIPIYCKNYHALGFPGTGNDIVA